MANVELTQKMIPFITCEITLCRYVCELVFGVNVLDLDFWVQIDPVKQPIQSNSVVRETCLIVGLLPLIIILITA